MDDQILLQNDICCVMKLEDGRLAVQSGNAVILFSSQEEFVNYIESLGTVLAKFKASPKRSRPSFLSVVKQP